MDQSIKLHSPSIFSLPKKRRVASGNHKRVAAIATDDKAYNMTCLSHFMYFWMNGVNLMKLVRRGNM